MARHTAKSHKIRKVEILVIQIGISAIRLTICPIFMNYLPDGRTKMTGSSGETRQKRAERICIWHVIRTPVCRRSMRSMTGLRMRDIRRFSAGMTGITVMRTGRLRILPWTGCGLGEIPGSRRLRENYRAFTAKSRADTGMVCF